jgi:hypothetical protein
MAPLTPQERDSVTARDLSQPVTLASSSGRKRDNCDKPPLGGVTHVTPAPKATPTTIEHLGLIEALLFELLRRAVAPEGRRATALRLAEQTGVGADLLMRALGAEGGSDVDPS